MKTLVLITANFPFGVREPFPGTEFPFLHNEFKRIIIIAQNTEEEQTRILPSDVKIYRYNPLTSLMGILFSPLLIIGNLKLIIKLFKDEAGFRINSGTPLSSYHRRLLFKKIIKAIQLRNFIESTMKTEKIFSDIIFYSYWLNSGAHAIGLLNYNNSIKIARAHGSDLYEEKTGPGYHPLLKHISDKLDSIFFISEDGLKYFIAKTGKGKAELNISKLGVFRPEFEDSQSPRKNDFTIVSCSNIIDIKRLDLIIKSLALTVSNRKIYWIHFGFGILRNEIEKEASEILGKNENIRYEFKGYVPNDEILRYYSRNMINLFLNTSSTEGVPVSIMEAQCFGIPVIATDVGGVSEMVNEETGFLLPPDFKPEELAEKITIFMNMEPEEELKYRNRVFSSWNMKFNASRNYPDFINKVNCIFDASTKRIS